MTNRCSHCCAPLTNLCYKADENSALYQCSMECLEKVRYPFHIKTDGIPLPEGIKKPRETFLSASEAKSRCKDYLDKKTAPLLREILEEVKKASEEGRMWIYITYPADETHIVASLKSLGYSLDNTFKTNNVTKKITRLLMWD